MNLVADEQEWLAKIEQFKMAFEAEMDDDFNTANAISVLFDVTREANMYLQEKQTTTKVIDAFLGAIETILGVLGIALEQEEQLLDDEVESLIEERNEARKARNFARADEIRDLLKEKNILLEDTPQGVRWKRG
ncbi:DALR domain-containing protein [Paracerasibacillus soli]